MKKARKLAAVLLSLVMLLALVIPAAAEGPYSITIQNNKEGHTYEAYQIFAGTVSSDNTQEGNVGGPMLGDIDWGNGVNGTELLAALKAADQEKYGACKTAADVAKALGAENAAAADAAAFADIAALHLAAVAETATAPNVDGNYVINNLAAGYYLVKDQDGSLQGDADTATEYIVQVLGNVTMEPKDSDIPTVEKKVQEDDKYTANDGYGAGYNDVADHEIGENFYFKLIGSIPDMGAYDTYTYTFHDTMSAGLSLTSTDKSNFEVFLTNDANAVLNGATQVAAENYDVDTNLDNGESFTVSFSNLKSVEGINGYNYIVVRFSAYLNQNAKVGSSEGNPNEVYLEFSNDPNGDGTGKTTTDKVIVFTYELDGTKVDGEAITTTLPGAQFVLLNADGGKVAKVGNDGKFNGWGDVPNGTGEDGAITYNDWADFDKSNKVILTSDDDGFFKVIGLDDGTYKLREIKAPNGYNLLEEDVQLVITADTKNVQDWAGEPGQALTALNISVNGGELQPGNTETGIVNVTVKNNQGATLPETGGMGTTLFYIIGGLLVVGAGILLVVRIRMRSHNE